MRRAQQSAKLNTKATWQHWDPTRKKTPKTELDRRTLKPKPAKKLNNNKMTKVFDVQDQRRSTTRPAIEIS